MMLSEEQQLAARQPLSEEDLLTAFRAQAGGMGSVPRRASRSQPPSASSRARQPAPGGPGRPAAGWPLRLRRGTGWLLCGAGLALLWLCWLGPALSAWVDAQIEQYQYGPAHVTTLDVDLGQGGRSHLLAQDLQGTILVLDVLPAPTGSSPQVSVCAFPHLVGETPGEPPQVVTLHVERLPGDPRPAVLVQVAGVPFPLVCRSTPQGLQPDPTAAVRALTAPRAGARRPR
jgi:hypothetical protein